MAKIREIGIRSRQIYKWAARTPKCRTDILDIDPLTIYEVAPAFLLLAFGLILSFFFCLFEKFFFVKKYQTDDIMGKLYSLFNDILKMKKKKINK